MKRRDFFSANRQGLNHKGFTLIEILVVLAIAAIVSAVTLGGFNEMQAGNKRVSCSTNLSQIYQAARLYASDEGGKFPYYEADCVAGTSEGIGLWALYTFPQGSSEPDASTVALVDSKPIERYIRSSKVLHCPADLSEDALTTYSNENFYNADRTAYNPGFLSYQTCDTEGGTPTPTYETQRIIDTTDPNWQRQLLHFDGTDFVRRQPTGDTVVTYCLHHRGDREMDNVLFYDGSIQLLPKGAAGDARWQRIPKAPQ